MLTQPTKRAAHSALRLAQKPPLSFSACLKTGRANGDHHRASLFSLPKFMVQDLVHLSG